MNRTVGGVDPAFVSDYFTSALIKREFNNPVKKLINLDAWHKDEWMLIKEALIKKKTRFNVFQYFVDATRDLPLVEEMKAVKLRTAPLIFTWQLKHSIVTKLTKDIVNGNFIAPKLDGELFQQSSPKQKKLLTDFWQQAQNQMKIQTSANPKYAHPRGENDDVFWSVGIANYGMDKIPNVDLKHSFITS
jgi:hypothetical protein